MVGSMNRVEVSVYCWSVFVLWLKFVLAISIQARERLRTRGFRYPEDASHWRGSVDVDTERCARAQSLVRNDTESQPYFLALGALYVAVGAQPTAALIYFPLYTLSRVAHAYFLLRGRQPHRTRVFGLGIAIITLLAIHAIVAVTRALFWN
jgi:uncharacterized MAPEG superfamily protein